MLVFVCLYLFVEFKKFTIIPLLNFQVRLEFLYNYSGDIARGDDRHTYYLMFKEGVFPEGIELGWRLFAESLGCFIDSYYSFVVILSFFITVASYYVVGSKLRFFVIFIYYFFLTKISVNNMRIFLSFAVLNLGTDKFRILRIITSLSIHSFGWFFVFLNKRKYFLILLSLLMPVIILYRDVFNDTFLAGKFAYFEVFEIEYAKFNDLIWPIVLSGLFSTAMLPFYLFLLILINFSQVPVLFFQRILNPVFFLNVKNWGTRILLSPMFNELSTLVLIVLIFFAGYTKLYF